MMVENGEKSDAVVASHTATNIAPATTATSSPAGATSSFSSNKAVTSSTDPASAALRQVRYLTVGYLERIAGVPLERFVGVSELDLGGARGATRRIETLENVSLFASGLRVLSLRNQRLHNVDALSQLSRLTALDLSGNESLGDGGDNLETTTTDNGSEQTRDRRRYHRHRRESARLSGLSSLTGLEVLDLSACALNEVPPVLASLRRLRVLKLGGNNITSLEGVRHLLHLPDLCELQIHGNPVARLPHARALLIAALPSLSVVDALDVTPEARAAAHRRFHSGGVDGQDVGGAPELLQTAAQARAVAGDATARADAAEVELGAVSALAHELHSRKGSLEEQVASLRTNLATARDVAAAANARAAICEQRAVEAEQALAFARIDGAASQDLIVYEALARGATSVGDGAAAAAAADGGKAPDAPAVRKELRDIVAQRVRRLRAAHSAALEQLATAEARVSAAADEHEAGSNAAAEIEAQLAQLKAAILGRDSDEERGGRGGRALGQFGEALAREQQVAAELGAAQIALSAADNELSQAIRDASAAQRDLAICGALDTPAARLRLQTARARVSRLEGEREARADTVAEALTRVRKQRDSRRSHESTALATLPDGDRTSVGARYTQLSADLDTALAAASQRQQAAAEARAARQRARQEVAELAADLAAHADHDAAAEAAHAAEAEASRVRQALETDRQRLAARLDEAELAAGRAAGRDAELIEHLRSQLAMRTETAGRMANEIDRLRARADAAESRAATHAAQAPTTIELAAAEAQAQVDIALEAVRLRVADAEETQTLAAAALAKALMDTSSLSAGMVLPTGSSTDSSSGGGVDAAGHQAIESTIVSSREAALAANSSPRDIGAMASALVERVTIWAEEANDAKHLAARHGEEFNRLQVEAEDTARAHAESKARTAAEIEVTARRHAAEVDALQQQCALLKSVRNAEREREVAVATISEAHDTSSIPALLPARDGTAAAAEQRADVAEARLQELEQEIESVRTEATLRENELVAEAKQQQQETAKLLAAKEVEITALHESRAANRSMPHLASSAPTPLDSSSAVPLASEHAAANTASMNDEMVSVRMQLQAARGDLKTVVETLQLRKSQLASLEASLTTARGAATAAEARRAEAEVAAAAAEARANEAEAGAQSAAVARASLETSRSEAESRAAAASERAAAAEALEVRATAAREALGRAETAYEDARARTLAAEARAAEAETMRTAAERESAELTAANRAADARLSEVTSSLEALSQTRSESQTQIRELEERTARARRSHEMIKVSLDEAEARLQRTQSSANEADNARHQLADQLHDLELAVARESSALREAKTATEAMRAETRTQEALVARLREEAEARGEEANAAAAKAAAAQAEAQVARIARADEERAVAATRDSLTAKQALNKMTVELRAEHDSLQEEVAALRRARDATAAEAEAIREDSEFARNALEAARTRLTTTESRLTSAATELAGRETQLHTLHAQLSRAEHQLESTAGLRAEAEDARRAAREANERSNKAQAQAETLLARLAESYTLVDTLQLRLRSEATAVQTAEQAASDSAEQVQVVLAQQRVVEHDIEERLLEAQAELKRAERAAATQLARKVERAELLEAYKGFCGELLHELIAAQDEALRLRAGHEAAAQASQEEVTRVRRELQERIHQLSELRARGEAEDRIVAAATAAAAAAEPFAIVGESSGTLPQQRRGGGMMVGMAPPPESPRFTESLSAGPPASSVLLKTQRRLVELQTRFNTAAANAVADL